MTKQERAKVMYTKKGMTLHAIAGVFHVSHVAVYRWLRDQKVTMRPRGRRAN